MGHCVSLNWKYLGCLQFHHKAPYVAPKLPPPSHSVANKAPYCYSASTTPHKEPTCQNQNSSLSLEIIGTEKGREGGRVWAASVMEGITGAFTLCSSSGFFLVVIVAISYCSDIKEDPLHGVNRTRCERSSGPCSCCWVVFVRSSEVQGGLQPRSVWQTRQNWELLDRVWPGFKQCPRWVSAYGDVCVWLDGWLHQCLSESGTGPAVDSWGVTEAEQMNTVCGVRGDRGTSALLHCGMLWNIFQSREVKLAWANPCTAARRWILTMAVELNVIAVTDWAQSSRYIYNWQNNWHNCQMDWLLLLKTTDQTC